MGLEIYNDAGSTLFKDIKDMALYFFFVLSFPFVVFVSYPTFPLSDSSNLAVFISFIYIHDIKQKA